MIFTEQAPAKINLTLDVLGKLPDGYHDLRMVMQSVSVCDTVKVSKSDVPGIRVQTGLSFLPNDDSNIAARAVRAFFAHRSQPCPDLFIEIEKRIPVCAGTAGGSSDGAAVLRGLNRAFGGNFSVGELACIGESVGSDVPYCVMGGTAVAEGKGEILTPLTSMPDCWLVLCKPPFPISTPELFHAIDSVKLRCHPDTEGMIEAIDRGDLRGIAMRLYNVFEEVLPPARRSVIDEIKSALLEGGAMGACMSGTGPTVFGIFDNETYARDTAARLKESYAETFVARPLGAETI